MNILKEYIEKFNKLDGNKDFGKYATYEWLKDNLPIFKCSDKTVEEIYYFRAYNFAKHICKNSRGEYIVTEFSIPVHWAKETEGAISCAVGHQLREIRWLKNANDVACSYVDFWLERIDGLLYYNNWFISGVLDYVKVSGEWNFAYQRIDKMIEYFDRQKMEHLAECGLYKSVDNYDGMELSISAYGIRPTICSYIYGNAYALYKILEKFNDQRASEYKEFCESLRKQINEKLFDKDFYYSLPLRDGERDEKYIPNFTNPNPTWGVKEEMGYVPFYFGIADKGHCKAFSYLLDSKVFRSPYGITTADKSHGQFYFKFGHSCLWNGPVWPFATSQTLTGLAKYLQRYNDLCVKDNDYVDLLHTYANSQYLREDGIVRPFIDEDLDGESGEWLARKWIKEFDEKSYPNGRGFDYNHSTFIDLVIEGLCGVNTENGVNVKPLVGDKIESFSLEGVFADGKEYNVYYNKKDGLTVK